MNQMKKKHLDDSDVRKTKIICIVGAVVLIIALLGWWFYTRKKPCTILLMGLFGIICLRGIYRKVKLKGEFSWKEVGRKIGGIVFIWLVVIVGTCAVLETVPLKMNWMVAVAIGVLLGMFVSAMREILYSKK